MFDSTLRVLLSHTSDFGNRPARGNAYIDAAFRALDCAEVLVTDMSLLPASECSPKQVSEGLAKDTDLYIGIIGWRYGSPVRESPEVSYTQLEFRTAAEEGVPRLVFMLGEEFKSKDADEPTFDRQVAFRNEITESGITVQWFDSPEKLEKLLFQSITNPPGWDPAFLRMFFSAAYDAAQPAPLIGLQAAPGVPLIARRIISSKEAERDLDPVKCAAEADRLVVLGGPGSGKSWLARQVARRAAEAGLVRLANREPLEKIELPLLVTISPFFGLVEQAVSVWDALVTQAVKELERFLPNHRCMSRIRRVFEPRNDRYFVILEGLDEAAQLRTTTARQIFDALIFDNCRLMLTSRPGRWQGQLDMTPKEGTRRKPKFEIIELQPLKQEQVRTFLRGAVQEQKAADALLKYLGRHPPLAEAARVPLIAQLIAIVGPAGTFRDLYDRAVNQIMRGQWRATESCESLHPYRAARALVREWAWRSAVEQNDPVSGLADWTDTIEVDFAESDPAVRSAVENVFPVVERDLDRMIERRRFLHQTIRERLVAEYIAGLALDEAAVAIEPHLWYDDTWHTIVPAAVAAYPTPTALLRRILAGDAADPEKGMTAFRARDGLGELGDMLVRLRDEASDSIWNCDPVLQPIFQSCLRQRGVFLSSEYREQVPDPEQVASDLRAGELPMPDKIVPWIRASGFSVAERSDLAEAVRRRLVSDRALSNRGTFLSRHHLAMALEALQPDQDALAGTRLQLTKMLADSGRRYVAYDVLAAILVLRPTDTDRKTIVPLAIAAIKDADNAYQMVYLAGPLMSLELAPEQKGEVRDALFAGLLREHSAVWMRELVGAFGATAPAANDVAACVSRALASKAYRDFDSHERKMVYGALCDLTAAYENQDELLLRIVRALRTGLVSWDHCNQVEQVASRSSPEALHRTAEEVVGAILQDRGWAYDGLKVLRLLNASTRLQRTVVDQLLALLQEPGAPWGTIGEAVANLEAADSQRSVAAEHMLSCLRKESDNRVKLDASRVLARLRPDENQRQKALSILRDRVPTLAGRDLEPMIAVLGALGPGGALDPADLRMIVEQLESHRFDESSLGFYWAGTLVDLGRPDPEIRKRLIAATLIPAARLGEVSFISFNDRLIDAGILAGDHEAPKRFVGDAYIEVLRKGVDRFRSGAPVLEPIDMEVILDRFSEINIARDQQEVVARLAATLLPNLILQDQDQLRATWICRQWRALNPPENLISQMAGVLIEAIRNPASARAGRTRLLQAALELEPSQEQRAQVAEIIIEEILANNEEIDAYLVGRVTITAENLHRLVSAGSVPTALLKVAAASTRRSVPLSVWKKVLPQLVEGASPR
jgi:hypothetical protein